MDELKHRIDLLKMKIDTAIARINQDTPEEARNVLRDALTWDKDIYE